MSLENAMAPRNTHLQEEKKYIKILLQILHQCNLAARFFVSPIFFS